MDKKEYAVYVSKETVIESIVKDIFTFGFIGLCIYISQGSTWWTFFTACIVFFLGYGKIMEVMGKSKKFRTKEDLQVWVDGLE